MGTMNESQYGNDFVTLTDDEGNEIELEHLDTLEYEGTTYMAFIPAEMSLDEEYHLMILKVETDEESQEEILATVEDEDVLDAVFEPFSQRLEDYFDGSDELTEEEELRRKGIDSILLRRWSCGDAGPFLTHKVTKRDCVFCCGLQASRRLVRAEVGSAETAKS